MAGYEFDAAKTAEECVKWIQEWFEKNTRNGNAVIGISGGKDSTTVAALCTRALGKDRVYGIMLPNGEQADISDSKELCDFLGIHAYVNNIKDGYDAAIESLKKNGFEISEQARINIGPRLRMDRLQAISQCVNGYMANTCNMSESHVGYSTLYGDCAGVFSPLDKLTVTEVIAIGDYLGVPYHLTHKAPSDGLCGQTDEDKLGFTYAELDRYIRTGEIDNPESKRLIDEKYRRNKFKMDMIKITTFDPHLPVAIEH